MSIGMNIDPDKLCESLREMRIKRRGDFTLVEDAVILEAILAISTIPAMTKRLNDNLEDDDGSF